MSDDTPATPATMPAAIVDDPPRPLDMVCDLTDALRALEHHISRLKLSAMGIAGGLREVSGGNREESERNPRGIREETERNPRGNREETERTGLLGMESALEADVTNCEKRLLCQTIGGQAKRVRGMAWADGTDEGGAA